MNQHAKGKKAESRETTLKIGTHMEPAIAPDKEHELENLILPGSKESDLPRLELVTEDRHAPHKGVSTSIFTTDDEYERRLKEFSSPSRVMKYGGFKPNSWKTEETINGTRYTSRGEPSDHFKRLESLYTLHAELVTVADFDTIYEQIYDPFKGPFNDEEWDILTRKTVDSIEAQEAAMAGLHEKKFRKLEAVLFEVAQERMRPEDKDAGKVNITPMLREVKRNGHDYD